MVEEVSDLTWEYGMWNVEGRAMMVCGMRICRYQGTEGLEMCLVILPWGVVLSRGAVFALMDC
jgi:hypothetical protein